MLSNKIDKTNNYTDLKTLEPKKALISSKYITNMKSASSFGYGTSSSNTGNFGKEDNAHPATHLKKLVFQNINSNHRRDLNISKKLLNPDEESKSDVKVDFKPEISNEMSQIASKLKSKE